MADGRTGGRTAGEAGWRASRYNVVAELPGTDRTVIVNLLRGTCHEFSPLEHYLLSAVEELDEHHPAIGLLAHRGVIANFDERAALEATARIECARPGAVGLTICPTLGCNFACPYCFEDRVPGIMTGEVQDDVVALAERMLEAGGARELQVNWFGGEPLLAPEVIGSLSGRLIDLARSRGAEYKASIVTNAYLLTQDIADMLARSEVRSALVTLDGIGAAHDATRHLAGGGATFGRIASNLRDLSLPFVVNVRHNVHEGNYDQVDALRAFVGQLAEESGNDLRYYPATVWSNEAAEGRGEKLGVVCGGPELDVRLQQDSDRFGPGAARFCSASCLWSAGVDPTGRLFKCWEAVDKPRYSFGTAREWDPRDPLATAQHPDLLCCYLNMASPLPDGECRECMWLPLCAGGCPHERLFHGQRRCLPYRDDPAAFALAVHGRLR